MVPAIESALEGIDKPDIKTYVDCTELDGWELKAMWNDFKFGSQQRSDFSKIAIVGNSSWQQLSAKVGGWFINGDIQYFEDAKQGLDWLLS